MTGRMLKGAVAGVAATWAMTRVTAAFVEQQDEDSVEAEREARAGESAYARAAGEVGRLVGADLGERQRREIGEGIRWGLGLGAGVGYALLRPWLPGRGAGRGLAFGAAFFGLVDELALPRLGLAPGFAAFPWQTHVRGLAGHAVFGIASEAVLQALGDPGRAVDDREPDLVLNV